MRIPDKIAGRPVDERGRARANARLALILGGIAVLFFVFGMWRFAQWAAG